MWKKEVEEVIGGGTKKKVEEEVWLYPNTFDKRKSEGDEVGERPEACICAMWLQSTALALCFIKFPANWFVSPTIPQDHTVEYVATSKPSNGFLASHMRRYRILGI